MADEGRTVPPGDIATRLADRLEDLAAQVRRLSPDWCQPERFYEKRSDIAGEIADIAHVAERSGL